MYIKDGDDMLVVSENEKMKQTGKRKHGSQMTLEEIRGVKRRLMDVKEWKIIDHAFDRLQEKGIVATYEDIVSTIYNSHMIEYRIVYNFYLGAYDERVIMRAKTLVNKHYHLNVVFSLTDNAVVTVWINHKKDRHDTLDMSIYDGNMKVFI